MNVQCGKKEMFKGICKSPIKCLM